MKSASKKKVKIIKKAAKGCDLVIPGKDVEIKFGGVNFESFTIPKDSSKVFHIVLPEKEKELTYTSITIPALKTPFPKLDVTPYLVPKEFVPAELPKPQPRIRENQYAIRVPGHYYNVFKSHESLKERVAAVVKVLKDQCGQVDAIAVCGISGMALLGAVSYETGIPMTVVRKRHEDPCHGYVLTGWLGSGRYVILDDLISSGATVNHVYETVRKEAGKELIVPPTLGGIVLHHVGYGGNYQMNDGTYVPTWYAKYDYVA